MQDMATPCLGKEANPARLPTLSTGAMKTETPIRMKTARPVSLCSLWVAAQVSQVPGVPWEPTPLPALLAPRVSALCSCDGHRERGQLWGDPQSQV